MEQIAAVAEEHLADCLLRFIRTTMHVHALTLGTRLGSGRRGSGKGGGQELAQNQRIGNLKARDTRRDRNFRKLGRSSRNHTQQGKLGRSLRNHIQQGYASTKQP